MESLTPDAVSQIINNSNENETVKGFNPVVQAVKVQSVKGPTSDPTKKRYRVVLSDGTHFCQGMIASQHNHMIENGDLKDFALIRVGQFMKNKLQGRPIVIMLSLQILSNPGSKIGNPTDIGLGNPTQDQGQGQSNGAQQPVRANTFVKPENRSNSSNPYNNTYGNGSGGGAIRQPGMVNSAPIVRTNIPSSGKPITPIAQLNMYQNRWTIKARLTTKGQIRFWSNAKGEGKLFSISLLDSSSDIRATFFKEAVDKFHDMLEVDCVYCLSGGRLKAANMQYNNCKSSYEITFDQNSEICKEDDTGDIVQQSYDLVPIVSLENTEPGGFVDVIGIVKSVGEPGTIMSKKSGKELNKCELIIGDDSGADVSVTIWGERANGAPNEFNGNPVVGFRRARVSDYGGRTLSASSDGIHCNPKIAEAQNLMQWWTNGGSSGATKSLSSARGGGASRFPKFDERKTIGAIKGENLGYTNAEKPDWISFKGTLSFIKSDREGGAWYTSCPETKVKMQLGNDGTFYCERCQRNYENCVYRYIFSATISDDTSTSWVSIFDDQASVLLGDVSANDLYEKLNADETGQSTYDGFFERANFTDWIFTCKVKQEMNQDEMRVKTSLHSLHPVDYAKEGHSLLNSILSM